MFPLLLAALALAEPPSGDGVLRGAFDGSPIEIVTTRRLAGAVHSLRWKGKEFIDSADHGRQLQSAASFDCGQPGFWPECFNPTEAGSRRDGAGATSTSRLLEYDLAGSVLRTKSRMAFWLPPGERSAGRLAKNTTLLSDHVLEKRIELGVGGRPNCLGYTATFTVPAGERHTLGQLEAVTGYMPAEFGQFWAVQPDGTLAALPAANREQARPLIASTPSGDHAMGVWSAQQPSKGYETAGYGHFTFPAERVCKWNCVFRVRDAAGIAPGDYRYEMVVAVGSREQVRATLAAVMATPR